MTEAELYPSTTRSARRRKPTNVDSMLKRPPRSESATRSCTRSTASAATWLLCRSTSATGRPSSCTSNTPIGQALRAGVEPAPDLATAAPRPNTRRCTRWARGSGRRPRRRRRSRRATRRPSCSTSTRSAPPAGIHSRSTGATTRPSPRASVSRRRPTRARDSGRHSGPGRGKADGPPRSAATSASARPRSRCAPPFVALMGGKQVAVLVPTTLLAEQHFSTFTGPLRAVADQDRGAVALPQHEGSTRHARRLAEGKVDS